jgi:hypothetical protein
MIRTDFVFLGVFIMGTSMFSVTESIVCASGAGQCNGYTNVCCNAINPRACCPVGHYCCDRAVNFGCCPTGYTCELTRCTRQPRGGSGLQSRFKANITHSMEYTSRK